MNYTILSQINFCDKNLKDLIKILQEKSSFGNKKTIFTLNPEFLFLLNEREDLFEIIKKSKINTVDGYGLQIALYINNLGNNQRITGVNLTEAIFEKVYDKKILIVFNKFNHKFDKQKSQNQIYFHDPGQLKENKVKFISDEINNYNADIVLLALPMKYQVLLSENIQSTTIGIGGAFDILYGKIKKAPKIMSRLGLEWIWRLFQEPKRFNRIFKAVFIFPVLIAYDSLRRGIFLKAILRFFKFLWIKK